jgi:hypothetical protein
MSDDEASTAAPDYIWVLGLPGGKDDRAGGFRAADLRIERRKVPVSQLRDNVDAFVAAMGEAVSGIPRALGAFSIDSLELSLEVSATGSVSLLGTGGEVSGTGGITLTLTRLKGTG